MNVREKLVQLLKDIMPLFTFEEQVDHLIAHGVTVQEWTPVTERLPETCVAVLARCFYHGKWRTLVCHTSKRNDGEWYTNEIGQWVPVTHWMPLPQPPKGE